MNLLENLKLCLLLTIRKSEMTKITLKFSYSYTIDFNAFQYCYSQIPNIKWDIKLLTIEKILLLIDVYKIVQYSY